MTPGCPQCPGSFPGTCIACLTNLRCLPNEPAPKGDSDSQGLISSFSKNSAQLIGPAQGGAFLGNGQACAFTHHQHHDARVWPMPPGLPMVQGVISNRSNHVNQLILDCSSPEVHPQQLLAEAASPGASEELRDISTGCRRLRALRPRRPSPRKLMTWSVRTARSVTQSKLRQQVTSCGYSAIIGREPWTAQAGRFS
jgi:hypothetical protein